ncbi:hypothetical protein FQN52_009044 [Onygenales sp. PD_12]|nr:hypothetical protein FQN52_009044 [Onygenales sp. PD_12]
MSKETYTPTTPLPFPTALSLLKSHHLTLSTASHALLTSLTIPERLSLLSGNTPTYPGLRSILTNRYNLHAYPHSSIPRLSIPGILFSDGPRGIVMGSSTAFPVPMARGATWDVSLEERVGVAIGLEGKAQGANFFGGICVNLPRHPGWGRVQETYSDEPVLLGEFGAAMTRGVQGKGGLMGCVKHFALNSMEEARFGVDVCVEEGVLGEVYLAHFRRVVEEGVDSVMTAYNSVNGRWAGENRELLGGWLRGRWGFEGVVISDFVFGFRDAVGSVVAGLDVEAPFKQQRDRKLGPAVERGGLDMGVVDKACERILRKQLEYALRTEHIKPDMSVVFCKEHRDLAREVAARSMVLLQNNLPDSDADSILPLNPTSISRLAVIGRLSNTPNTGDKGSSAVFSPHVVTPYEGLSQALPNADVLLDDSDSVDTAISVATTADTAIIIAGYDAGDEGEYVVPSFQTNPELLDLLPPPQTDEEKEVLEIMKGNVPAKPDPTNPGTGDDGMKPNSGGDRRSLRPRPRDVEIIQAVSAVNKRTIVVIIAAGAVIMEEWRNCVPAILLGWYSGCEGGHALADVLLGKVDASGRLPFSIPRDESHLPEFPRGAGVKSIVYERWYGQGLLDRLGVEAAWPAGWGMGYTRFDVCGEGVVKRDEGNKDKLRVGVKVRNLGGRDGWCVLQVYGRPGVEELPKRMLMGFLPVFVKVGGEESVVVEASVRPLQRWIGGIFVLTARDVTLEVGQYAGDQSCVSVPFSFAEDEVVGSGEQGK